MKWWLSEEIQTQYGKEMEGLMGEAARYPTANVKAFANLPWPTDDYEALEEQFKKRKKEFHRFREVITHGEMLITHSTQL